MQNHIEDYKYDAFISYCHLPLDAAVAKKLEELLENLKVSKKAKKIKVFRDKDELKASNDLHSEIRDALLQSRYLITVCSEKTKKSPWCMEEIRLFKEAHGNSTKNILTMLVSGDPDSVFPDLLRWEAYHMDAAQGRAASYKREVVPLSADVRAKTRRQSLRNLKTEFLKIAAVILGCEYDELYQRQQRRKRKRAALISAGTITVLSVVLIVVAVFAYRAWVSENNYRDMLASQYAQEGSGYADAGSAQEALLYYTKSLLLNPHAPSAAAGAALILQEYDWPVQKEERQGCLKNKVFLPVPLAQAGDNSGDCYLTASRNGRVVDKAGSQLAELGEDYGEFLGDSAGWWSFRGEKDLFFYQPKTGQRRSIPWPKDSSAGCREDSLVDYGPSALALPDDRAVVAYHGIIHIYAFDAQGAAKEQMQADLGEALTLDAAHHGIAKSNEIYLSSDSSLMLVNSSSNVALYSTKDLTLKTTVVQYGDFLTGMDFSPENDYFALTYGNAYRSSHSNPGGHFEVYSIRGEQLFRSMENSREACLGTAFYPDNPEYLAVWGLDFVRVWNWAEGKETAAPVKTDGIRSVCFEEDGSLLVDHDGRTVSAYTFARMQPVPAALAEGEGRLPITVGQYYMDVEGPDGMQLSVGVSKLTLKDSKGSELDTASLPAMGERIALSSDSKRAYLYNTNYPALMQVPVDFEAGTLGEVQRIDTGNEAVLGIWFGNGWLAAETKSRNLLLFDQEGKQAGKIEPKHLGTIDTVLVDSNLERVVLVLEADKFTQARDFHYSTNGMIEIWDTALGLLLADFEHEGHKIEQAGITADGALAWNAGGKNEMRRLSVPAPDEVSLEFLRGLCSLDLDEKQDFVCKKPVDSGFQMGNWMGLASRWDTGRVIFGQEEQGPFGQESSGQESFGQESSGQESFGQESSGQGATEQTLLDLAKEFAAAENFADHAWFLECDDVWQQLLDGGISYKAMHLDAFYHTYKAGAEQAGEMDWLAFGLKAYIRLTLEWMKGQTDTDNVDFSDFDTQMIQTLASTKAYDEEIMQAFRDIITYSLADEEETPAYNDGLDTEDMPAKEDGLDAEWTDAADGYTMQYFQALLQALEGNGASAMADFAKYCDAEPQIAILAPEPSVFASLYAQDASQAADTVNAWLVDLSQMLSDQDYAGQILEKHLLLGDALVWRGQLSASVFDAYLRGIDADIGLEVQETSTEAQKAGLRIGDLILGVNGSRAADACHYRRLKKAAADNCELEILRNGSVVTLQMAGPAAFWGKMAFRIHE